jgi:type IV pilus assembly protein PilE
MASSAPIDRRPPLHAAAPAATGPADGEDAGTPRVTLLEVLVTVAIVATVAGFAVPSYERYVHEAGRADAQAALFDLATREERYYHAYGRYTDVIVAPPGCTGPACGLGASDTSPAGHYRIAAGPGRSRDLATSFELTATVAQSGPQHDDEGCAVLTLDSAGNTKPAHCW